MMRQAGLRGGAVAWGVIVMLMGAAAAEGHELRPAGPERFFVTPGEEAELTWWPVDGAVERETIAFTVYDYWDEPVRDGRARLNDEGQVRAAVELEAGYYSVGFEGSEQRFGVVALPAFEGEADPFFCIDSALSWLVLEEDVAVRGDFAAVREGLVEVLGRSGVAMSRERMFWANVQPGEGQWDWETERHYQTLREVYAAHELSILELFHDAPGFLGTLMDGPFPEDLVRAGEAWERIGQRWGGMWGGLEVWNEPNIHFGGDKPADQYAALAKAVSHAMDRAAVEVPVGGGVVAGGYDGAYLDDAARNGLLEVVDFYSFHTYGHTPMVEQIVARYRQGLEEHGYAAMPLWLTESGRPWPMGTDRPGREAGMVSALDNTMKAIEARAAGVERHFVFVYPYYEEDGNNFGMMGREATPLRAMGGYAQAIRMLAHKRYLGDWRGTEAGVVQARVFGDAEEAVIVLYTGRADEGASVAAKVPGSAEVFGMDGRRLALGEEGRVPVPDGLAYVRLEREALGERLVEQTPTMRLYRLGQEAGAETWEREPAGPIVLQFVPDPEAFHASVKGYRPRESEGEAVSIPVRVVNLGQQPHEVRVELADAEGQALGGPRVVDVSAGAFAEVEWEVKVEERMRERMAFDMEVRGRSESAERIEPAMIRVRGNATMEGLLGAFAKRERLALAEMERWAMVAPAEAETEMAPLGEAGWRLDVAFHDAPDRWIYPRFEVEDLSNYEGLVLKGRSEGPATVRMFLWQDAEQGGGEAGYLTQGGVFPADGQWHAVYVPFEELNLHGGEGVDPAVGYEALDLERVKQIAIGMNSEAGENRLEIEEAWLVGE